MKAISWRSHSWPLVQAAYSEWEKKHPAPAKKKGKAYIRTSELFEVFTIAIFAVEIVFLWIFILQLF